MLEAGIFHTLKVKRNSEYGLFLTNEEGDEVLLPNRYISPETKIGDLIEVFLYHDSESRLVATTERPLATVGEIAALKVVDKNLHGAFLEWGLTSKHLFVPNSNQTVHMQIGKTYAVYLYRDNISGRVVATARLGKYISNETISVKHGEQVDIVVDHRAASGWRVVVDNRHWGMLYDNQLFRPVHAGDRFTAYVRKVTEDHRIDVSLQMEGLDEVKASAERIVDLLKANGGRLDLCDKSTPDEIANRTGMSKKTFKKAVGYLLSHDRIVVSEHGIQFK